MKTIYKYPLEVKHKQLFKVPVDIKPLSVQVQNGTPCLWAEVDNNVAEKYITVYTIGTGIELPEGNIVYSGTYQYEECLVFHIYIENL